MFFFAPLFEETSFKLSVIVTDQDPWGAESCENVFPHELNHLPPCDCGQGLGLDPLGEEINNNQKGLGSTQVDREWANNVYTLLMRRPWAAETGEWHGGLVLESGESLALRVFFCELGCVLVDLRPAYSKEEYFSGEWPCALVCSNILYMAFFQERLPFGFGYIFKPQQQVSALV